MDLDSYRIQNGHSGAQGDLEDQCRATLQEIRVGLIEALDAAGVDCSRPREAARQLGLDKSLVWRVSKIVGQPDVFQVVSNMPHRAGMNILCKALKEAGVGNARVRRLRDAQTAFEAFVAHHAGDRATFELVVRGLQGSHAQGPSLEQDRKQAFRGTSAVWSAQARVQLSTAILLPNAEDPTMVDMVHLFGLVDLRRFRSDVRWTLTRRRVFDDASSNVWAPRNDALDPEDTGPDLTPIRRFSSDNFPDLIVEEVGSEIQCSLPEGRLGRTGELTTIFGTINKAIGSVYASETDQYCQTVARTLTPAENLHFDILVHEDLPWAMNPKPAVHGSLDGREYHMGCGRRGFPLPFSEKVVELGQGLAGTATPLMPWYRSMLEWAHRAAGLDPSQFRGYRFEMAYPPVPGQVILYSNLMPAAERKPG